MPPHSDLYWIITDIGKFLEAHNGAISAVSTLFVAAFTYTLWRATTRLWRASVQHASHAERGIDVVKRSAERQLRAYVGISSTKLTRMDSPTGPEARITIRNFGQTPAYDVSVVSGLALGPYPPPENFGSAKPPMDLVRPIYPLGPRRKTIQFSSLNRKVTEMEAQAFYGGAIAFYLITEITYTDIFNKARYWRGKMFLGGRASPEVSTSFSFWHQGNEAN